MNLNCSCCKVKLATELWHAEPHCSQCLNIVLGLPAQEEWVCDSSGSPVLFLLDGRPQCKVYQFVPRTQQRKAK